tara:strand:+ start:4837 stop:5493 length:657 start_codon:yes stop_codon:yes gene_type:complete
MMDGKKSQNLYKNFGKLLNAVDFDKVADLLGEKDHPVIDVTPDQKVLQQDLPVATEDGQVWGVTGRLERMKEMIEIGRLSPHIRQLVGRAVRQCRERDQMCELRAIHDYIAEHTRFLDDIRDIELFQEPEVTLHFNAGDCDDLSILAGSMLESAGFKTSLVAVGQSGYDHVFVRADYPKPPERKKKTVSFDLSIPDKTFDFDPTQIEKFNKIKIVEID